MRPISTVRPSSLRGFIYRQPISRIPALSNHYHSYEHDRPSPFSPTETAVLSAGSSHVPEHGFTLNALRLGARDAGYLDISTNLFPTGAFSLISYHLITQRLALASIALPESSSSPPPSSDVSSNIRTLALARLHANRPIIHHWQSALAQLATPKYLPTATTELARLADEILFLAGSTTVTTAWYTDRAAVAAIYASAELFMTTDSSKDFVETEGFLMRRLDEGERVKSGVGMMGMWAGGQIGGLLDGLRSKGVWI